MPPSIEELLAKAQWLSYFYLQFRPRTEHEMREYLTKKKPKHKLTDTVINIVINTLKEENLIDDKLFISWLVDKRSRTRQRSMMLLRRELMKHGVDKDLIHSFFEEKPLEELPLALQALKVRWKRIASLGKRDRFIRAARFLQGRGFSYGVIKNAIAEMEEKSYNEDGLENSY